MNSFEAEQAQDDKLDKKGQWLSHPQRLGHVRTKQGLFNLSVRNNDTHDNR